MNNKKRKQSLSDAINDKQNSSKTNFKIAVTLYNTMLESTPPEDNTSVGEILMFIETFYQLSSIHCLANCNHPIFYSTHTMMDLLVKLEHTKISPHDLLDGGEVILEQYYKLAEIDDHETKTSNNQAAILRIEHKALLLIHDNQKN